MNVTLDPTQEPIDLLPLRRWEVRKVRARLAEMQSELPAPTREARAVLENVIEAHRAIVASRNAASEPLRRNARRPLTRPSQNSKNAASSPRVNGRLPSGSPSYS